MKISSSLTILSLCYKIWRKKKKKKNLKPFIYSCIEVSFCTWLPWNMWYESCQLAGLAPSCLFGAPSGWRIFGLWWRLEKENAFPFPGFCFVFPLLSLLGLSADLDLWASFSHPQHFPSVLVSVSTRAARDKGKPVPNEVESAGMKPFIKCKNKAAWHFPLFWKRFLNYQAQHLPFLSVT